MELHLQTLRYPIGGYAKPAYVTPALWQEYLQTIQDLPALLHREVAHLSDEQLDTPYRNGGWSIRQVVHHCADSHLNLLLRIKLALTEDRPIVKPFDENLWAELPDSLMPIGPSLQLLAGTHARLAVLMRQMTGEQRGMSFYHPEERCYVRIDECAAKIAWHGRHHLGQISLLKARKSW